MATKQEVADYINANFSTSWSAEEEAKIDAIRLVDVSLPSVLFFIDSALE